MAGSSSAGAWQRGYVHGPGGGLLALLSGGVSWACHDATTKSQRLADVAEPGPGAGAAMLAEGAQPTGLWTWSNTIRTQYAQMEKDAPTGLDHTPFRKYDSGRGRWTSPDPYGGSMSASDPQTFNRYSYVSNDPVNRVDPPGAVRRGRRVD